MADQDAAAKLMPTQIRILAEIRNISNITRKQLQEKPGLGKRLLDRDFDFLPDFYIERQLNPYFEG